MKILNIEDNKYKLKLYEIILEKINNVFTDNEIVDFISRNLDDEKITDYKLAFLREDEEGFKGIVVDVDKFRCMIEEDFSDSLRKDFDKQKEIEESYLERGYRLNE